MIRYKDYDYVGEFNLQAAEKRLILRAFKRHKGHRINMAKDLGITDRTLFNKIFQHGLDFNDVR